MQNSATESLPDLEEAYATLKGLLFHALATLARQGYVVPPTEGLDLIHDFFLDAWPGLEARFDPSKGTPKAYVYGAFVRFARPRINRLYRLHDRLQDASKLARLVTKSQDPSGRLDTHLDTEIVAEAVKQLSSYHRSMLHTYFSGNPPSQRKLAREFGVSRYRVKESLAEAIGHLATFLDRPDYISEQDWRVTTSLLQGARSLKETSARLGLSPYQTKAIHNRNLATIAQSLT